MQAQLRYSEFIAACGMNCGLCIGFLREKKPCMGCYKKDDKNKPKVCRSCAIVNCELLAQTKSGFCYDCDRYPCSRLKRLDKRYKSNYGMSMLANLDYIQKNGIGEFLKNEQERWTCEACGSGVSVHRDYCLKCNANLKD